MAASKDSFGRGRSHCFLSDDRTGAEVNGLSKTECGRVVRNSSGECGRVWSSAVECGQVRSSVGCSVVPDILTRTDTTDQKHDTPSNWVPSRYLFIVGYEVRCFKHLSLHLDSDIHLLSLFSRNVILGTKNVECPQLLTGDDLRLQTGFHQPLEPYSNEKWCMGKL